MRVSSKHRFIFFAHPKTGSQGMHSILDPYSDPGLSGDQNPPGSIDPHITPADFAAMNLCDMSAYRKFAVARNPWARLVSAYEWKLSAAIDPLPSFREWLLNVFPYDAVPAYPMSACEFSGLAEGKTLVDRVVRLEDIEVEFPQLLDWLGLPAQDFPCLNKIDHPHYSTYYDGELRDLVAARYADDIERFGYCFEAER